MIVSLEKTYKTKNNLSVVIYAIYKDQTNRVHGAYFEDGLWTQASWKLDGTHPYPNRVLDLIEVKPRIKRTFWVNVYEKTGTIHNTKERANYLSNVLPLDEPDGRIACVKVEIDYEEGEGL